MSRASRIYLDMLDVERRVYADDHTQHFHDSAPLARAAEKAGFHVALREEFKGFFALVGEKNPS